MNRTHAPIHGANQSTLSLLKPCMWRISISQLKRSGLCDWTRTRCRTRWSSRQGNAGRLRLLAPVRVQSAQQTEIRNHDALSDRWRLLRVGPALARSGASARASDRATSCHSSGAGPDEPGLLPAALPRCQAEALCACMLCERNAPTCVKFSGVCPEPVMANDHFPSGKRRSQNAPKVSPAWVELEWAVDLTRPGSDRQRSNTRGRHHRFGEHVGHIPAPRKISMYWIYIIYLYIGAVF